jgi:hypothetical protein
MSIPIWGSGELHHNNDKNNAAQEFHAGGGAEA